MLLWIGLALIGGVILAIGGALLLTNIMERRQAASVLSGRRAHGHDIDFIEAENSMGFHAPQEAARLLGNAMNYARMGQVALRGGRPAPVGTGVAAAAQGEMPPQGHDPSPAPEAQLRRRQDEWRRLQRQRIEQLLREMQSDTAPLVSRPRGG